MSGIGPVLGVIPARGGSKGIPRKNIAPLLGRPLLAYTADAALASRRLSRIILSTDDEEIASVGRAYGLETPFLRPAELAADDTASLGVVQHALGWAEGQGEQYGAVCLLQPTSPLRTAEEIDGCIDLIGSTGADSAVTVLPVPDKYNPHWVYEPDANGRLVLSTGEAEPITRRQILPPAFHREGSVYVTRRNVLVAGSLYGRSVVGYLVHEDDSVNIDTPDDLVRAERRLAARCSVSAAARA